MTTATRTARLSDIGLDSIKRINAFDRVTGEAAERTSRDAIERFVLVYGYLEMTWDGEYWHNTHSHPGFTSIYVVVRP